MAPAFGFSVGDFINALSLINKIRKALKDTDGAKDDIDSVLLELEQLELILNQLIDGNWGSGSDVGYVNAVRGMAVFCQIPLERYLKQLENFRLASVRSENFRYRLRGVAIKSQCALSMKDETSAFRSVVTSRIVLSSLLMSIPIKYVDHASSERINQHSSQSPSLL